MKSGILLLMLPCGGFQSGGAAVNANGIMADCSVQVYCIRHNQPRTLLSLARQYIQFIYHQLSLIFPEMQSTIIVHQQCLLISIHRDQYKKLKMYKLQALIRSIFQSIELPSNTALFTKVHLHLILLPPDTLIE